MGSYRTVLDFSWKGIPLNKVLENHKIWIETKGIEGEKAVLTGADLQEINLEYTDLRAAVISEVNLRKANLINISLRGLTKKSNTYRKLSKVGGLKIC